MTSAVSTPDAMALRDYQQEAITAITAAWLRGIRRPLIALPTGSGKTIVFAHLASYRRGRTLILAHRDELIQQAADKLAMVDPTLELGIVKAGQDEHDMLVSAASSRHWRPTRKTCRTSSAASSGPGGQSGLRTWPRPCLDPSRGRSSSRIVICSRGWSTSSRAGSISMSLMSWSTYVNPSGASASSRVRSLTPAGVPGSTASSAPRRWKLSASPR
jgi:hypothetical protein